MVDKEHESVSQECNGQVSEKDTTDKCQKRTQQTSVRKGHNRQVSEKDTTDKCQKRTQQTSVRKGNVTDWPLQLGFDKMPMQTPEL